MMSCQCGGEQAFVVSQHGNFCVHCGKHVAAPIEQYLEDDEDSDEVHYYVVLDHVKVNVVNNGEDDEILLESLMKLVHRISIESCHCVSLLISHS